MISFLFVRMGLAISFAATVKEKVGYFNCFLVGLKIHPKSYSGTYISCTQRDGHKVMSFFIWKVHCD